ncbi:hypothetical protein KUTeg_014005 [Tegillarca granosa]|uniref:Uncharacterized protein n=1 Tax=Tegillarca granosa TaxID=220873 RepID=A0ABQ9EYW9_TEGGR|nr:hypothetical protein KUTeg_014005 [Tegillarca granosa]
MIQSKIIQFFVSNIMNEVLCELKISQVFVSMKSKTKFCWKHALLCNSITRINCFFVWKKIILFFIPLSWKPFKCVNYYVSNVLILGKVGRLSIEIVLYFFYVIVTYVQHISYIR